ncbi:MAG: hypothetical protein WAW06_03835 [bacterium]
MPEKPRPTCWLADLAGLVALCALAFLLTWKAGFRGFYPFDQSIVFDGGYRVASGQVPYRDFVMPFGPVAFWLQAMFFRTLGVSYAAYVAGAAVVNVLAALAAVALVRLVVDSGRGLSYLAGVVTAVWFYPPFGTPWVDQTAFFFALLGLVALLAGVRRAASGGAADVLVGLAGAAAFLSIMAKQNAGGFMLPLFPLALALACLPDARRFARNLGVFAVGLGGSAAAFVVWLAAASDAGNFSRYVIALPSHLGRERLASLVATGFGLARPYFGDRAPRAVNAVVAAALVVSIVALAYRRRLGAGKDAGRRAMVAAGVCAYLVLFQHLFMNTTLNQQQNAYAFLGPIAAIGVWLALGLVRTLTPAGDPGARRLLRRGLAAGVWVLAFAATALTSVDGVKAAMSRKVHDIFEGCSFDRPMVARGLEGLRWADPTLIRGFEVRQKDFLDLVVYLRERDLNFLVFPDFTVLYGLVGAPSPQPVLWFHEGVTYGKEDTSALDRWIVESLEMNGVKLVVIEQVAWYNTGERLNAFPRLRDYVYGRFTRLGQIGTFSIYERSASAP